MGKEKKARHGPDLSTRAKRLAYAQFSLRAGLPLPGEKEAEAAILKRHPPEVEESIIWLLRDIDCDNPRAFLEMWTPEEIILELTVILITLNNDGDRAILNPPGLLWSMLSARYPKVIKR